MKRKHTKHSRNSRTYTQINKGAQAPTTEIKDELYETGIDGLMMNKSQVDLFTYGALFNNMRDVHPFAVVMADFLFQYIVNATDEYVAKHHSMRDFCREELEDVVSILLKGNDEYRIPTEWYGGDVEAAMQEAVKYLIKIRAVFVMSDRPNLITVMGCDNVDQLPYSQVEAENRVILNPHFADEYEMFLDSAYRVVVGEQAAEVRDVLKETLTECEKDGNGVIDNRYFCVKKMFDYLAGL
ncbi:hypothetical protein QWR64_004004 [Escherichia coli]|nr:hypothetical protein [Escherichia coli]